MFSFNSHEITLFIVFNILVILMLIVDLGLGGKKDSHMTVKKASIWTLIWFSLAILFSSFIYFYDTDPSDPNRGKTKMMEYLAGYLLEKSLSIDNLFVFIMIFQKFKISSDEQPIILKWGIIGAVLLRAIMIAMGSAVVSQFGWILYIFGLFLIYTAIKMFQHKEEEDSFDPDKSVIMKYLGKIIPISKKPHNQQFFIRENGKLYATSFFAVLVMIEFSDVVFALDSIPAVFTVSQDPLIVYTSNIFAILGLRALYFMINGIMDLFVYLKTGVAILLFFVGAKMLLPLPAEFSASIPKIHLPIWVSLTVIIAVLVGSILLSLPKYLQHKREKEAKGL